MFRQLFDKAVRLTNVTSHRLCTSANSTTTYKPRIRASDLNQVQVVGNVGFAPEIKSKGHVGFVIANHKNYQTKQREFVKKTMWIRVIATRQYLVNKVMDTVNKGDQLLVLGSINTSNYRDEETNKNVSIFYLVADQVHVLKPYKSSLGAQREEDGLSSTPIDLPEDEDFDHKTEEEL